MDNCRAGCIGLLKKDVIQGSGCTTAGLGKALSCLCRRIWHCYWQCLNPKPQFVLHSADRHSGGSVGYVSLVAAVIQSRIGPDNRFLQSFQNRYSAYHRKWTGLTPTQKHSGRPVGSVPQVTGVTLSKFSKTSIRNRTDSSSKPTRTISDETTGCTPTKFVVNSEPSLTNQNWIRWHQHPAHRKWV